MGRAGEYCYSQHGNKSELVYESLPIMSFCNLTVRIRSEERADVVVVVVVAGCEVEVVKGSLVCCCLYGVLLPGVL